MKLHDLVIQSALRYPHALAVRGPDRDMSYAELNATANYFAEKLLQLDVRPGDRIGIWHDKSALTVAVMQGILRVGAIYVPCDPLSPAARVQAIISDCGIRVLFTTQERAKALANRDTHTGSLYYFDLGETTTENYYITKSQSDLFQDDHIMEDDVAYILYTSGSTGTPKGVCISHRNALAFVEWAVGAISVTPEDRLANHAPFHFDLSVFDLYAAFSAGATVVIIPEQNAYMPNELVHFLLHERITIWYSVPSVLILMLDYGNLLQVAPSDLRCILFAGEPFPIKHLRRLYKRWPTRRYFNFYGPTETNVCTYYEVTTLPDSWTKSVPIGQACSGDYVWLKKDDGTDAQPGDEGELMVEGPTVMVGYWGKPKQGEKPYATGDIVRVQDDHNYVYVGRQDHLVKIRGYRIELGDVEAVLEEHPLIHEAVVLMQGSGVGARLVAFVTTVQNVSLSLLELKQHCAHRLPRYMIIDAVRILAALPRTGNGKVDRFHLAQLQ